MDALRVEQPVRHLRGGLDGVGFVQPVEKRHEYVVENTVVIGCAGRLSRKAPA
jgi:hypothetical protein